MDSEETVTISKSEYDRLLKQDRYAQALDNAGVDNWEGHYIAMQELHGEDDEEA